MLSWGKYYCRWIFWNRNPALNFYLRQLKEKKKCLVSFQRNQEALEKDKLTPMSSADNFILLINGTQILLKKKILPFMKSKNHMKFLLKTEVYFKLDKSNKI